MTTHKITVHTPVKVEMITMTYAGPTEWTRMETTAECTCGWMDRTFFGNANIMVRSHLESHDRQKHFAYIESCKTCEAELSKV